VLALSLEAGDATVEHGFPGPRHRILPPFFQLSDLSADSLFGHPMLAVGDALEFSVDHQTANKLTVQPFGR